MTAESWAASPASPPRSRKAWTATLFLAGAVLGSAVLAHAGAAHAQDAGEDAWNKAGCFTCHGADGEGGSGGEFPAGPSLRKTKLDRATIQNVVSCGLPGTQMPSWLDGAYTETSCYGFPPGPAPDGIVLMPVLSADEITALLDYLGAKIVGK